MIDWRKFNKPSDIPEEIIREARAYTRGKTIIDFGSGLDEREHIDFLAERTVRLEKSYGIASQTPVADIDDRASLDADANGIVVVFFRVLSILSVVELTEVQRWLAKCGSRIDHVIIYDYTIDERKLVEYTITESWLGPLHKVRAEWSHQDFVHFSSLNLARLVSLPVRSEKYVTIPAHKRADGRGVFLVFGIR